MVNLANIYPLPGSALNTMLFLDANLVFSNKSYLQASLRACELFLLLFSLRLTNWH